jgi:hypothetical protein
VSTKHIFSATTSAKCIESCFKSFRALIRVIASVKDPKHEDRVEWAITLLDSIMIEDELIRVVFATMDTAAMRYHTFEQRMEPVSILGTKFSSSNFIIRCRAVHTVAMLYQGGMDLGDDDLSLEAYSILECKRFVNHVLGTRASAPMVVDCFLLLMQSLLE